MKSFLFIIVCSVFLYINTVNAYWVPTQGMQWNYVLSGNLDETKETAGVVDIDVNKSQDKIDRLHAKGIRVICYFSGGTIEDFRDDYNDFASVRGLVRNTYEAWPDENWLDFRIDGIKPLLEKRIKLAASKKCDGIEVDNLDGYQMSEVKEWNNPLTKQDTITFAKWLANTAHSYDLSIGLKNVVGIIDELSSYFDFAINESCVNYNECGLYKNFLAQGKAVFGVTYDGLDNNLNALCKNLNNLNISTIVKTSSKLVQSGIVFNGVQYCGSSFTAANNLIASTTKRTTTTTRRTTTTTRRTTTTTTRRTTTTTTRRTTTTSTRRTTTTTRKTTTTTRRTTTNNIIATGSNYRGITISNNNNCFSTQMGYPCCPQNSVVYTDNTGSWGIQNGNWCGVKAPESVSSCFASVLGYPCCSKYAKVITKDNDGSWGVENGVWCGIGASSCFAHNLGYACCSSSNAKVYYVDNSGEWGVENGLWCGIVGSNKTTKKITTTKKTTTTKRTTRNNYFRYYYNY